MQIKVIKMLALFQIRILSLTSIVDFFKTRFYQLKDSAHQALWERNLTKVKPPLEQDLTSMLDAAERQNYLRSVLK